MMSNFHATLLVRAMAIQAEIEAMKLANKAYETRDPTRSGLIPYSHDDIMKAANELERIADDMRRTLT